MPNAEDAKKAIAELNGKELDGRAIRVNEAMDKKEGGTGGGRPQRSFNNDRGGNGGGQGWN